MRVLVTGARGFLGQTCLAALNSPGVEIHAVSRFRGMESAFGAIWHTADLMDEDQVTGLLYQIRPTHLLHLAWETTPGKYWTCLENLDWLVSGLRLIRAFAEVGGRRFVGAGTCAEYDWGEGGKCYEDRTPCRPQTLYGACKSALWQAAMPFARKVSVSAAWGRVFFLYGPGEHPQRLVSATARGILKGEPVQCTTGTQERDFLHIADAGSAFAALLHSDVDGAVNIGSGEPTAVADIVRRLGSRLGRPDLIKLGALPMPPTEPALLYADVGRLKNEVGWHPRYSLADGLDETAAWWTSNSENRTS